jgi:putative IMPACT (imprinted ancient) family translation regulator
MGDIAVVVARYFGGTKLGTGGLVRAYRDAVRGVLAILPRARKVATHKVRFTIPYSGFERVRRLLAAHHGQIQEQLFGAEFVLVARLAIDEFDGFQNVFQEAFAGCREIEILETDPATLLPLI